MTTLCGTMDDGVSYSGINVSAAKICNLKWSVVKTLGEVPYCEHVAYLLTDSAECFLIKNWVSYILYVSTI